MRRRLAAGVLVCLVQPSHRAMILDLMQSSPEHDCISILCDEIDGFGVRPKIQSLKNDRSGIFISTIPPLTALSVNSMANNCTDIAMIVRIDRCYSIFNINPSIFASIITSEVSMLVFDFVVFLYQLSLSLSLSHSLTRSLARYLTKTFRKWISTIIN